MGAVRAEARRGLSLTTKNPRVIDASLIGNSRRHLHRSQELGVDSLGFPARRLQECSWVVMDDARRSLRVLQCT